MTGSHPDVEWLDDDGPSAPDEDLPQPSRPQPHRRRVVIAAVVVAVGVAAAVVVSGTDGDDRHDAGPRIPTFSPGNATGHLPVPGTSIAINDGSASGDDGPFDPRTGRAHGGVPIARCGSPCSVGVTTLDPVRAALKTRFPEVEGILVQTYSNGRGFVGRTIRANSGDREIRVFVLRTRRDLPDYVQRVYVRNRTVVQVLLHRDGLEIAVTVDRPTGSLSTTSVVALSGDRRLLSRR